MALTSTRSILVPGANKLVNRFIVISCILIVAPWLGKFAVILMTMILAEDLANIWE